ncbi:hypothetical protein AC1031_004191 [Aphanomyces cochlioides]|nr:hypothetical protein AC1031_004191 [Aphanomyces cochlioides]
MAAVDRRQFRMLTRGLTRDCIEEGILDAADVKPQAPLSSLYSPEFVWKLDGAIQATFGSALWQDILHSQKMTPTWSTHGWSEIVAEQNSLYASAIETRRKEPTNIFPGLTTEEAAPEEVQEGELTEEATPDEVQKEEPAEEVAIAAGPEPVDVLPPLESMLKLIRLAQSVKRAARKFKSLLSLRDHPMYIHLLHGSNLRAADWNGASDPYVLVTCFEGKHRANTQTIKSEIAFKTLEPQWDQRILLPGVKRNATLCLTVLDYDFGSNPDFLGQVIVPLDSIKETVTKIPLGPLMYIPEQPDGTPMQFGDKHMAGQGSITFALETCPNVKFVGDLQVLAPLDPKKWFQPTPVFQSMFATLFTDRMVVYTPEDKAQGKATAIIPLATIQQMLDDGNEWTFRLKDNREWRFRVDYAIEDRDLQHDRWLKALCRTTRRPVLVETSPSQFQFKFQPVAVA